MSLIDRITKERAEKSVKVKAPNRTTKLQKATDAKASVERYKFAKLVQAKHQVMVYHHASNQFMFSARGVAEAQKRIDQIEARNEKAVRQKKRNTTQQRMKIYNDAHEKMRVQLERKAEMHQKALKSFK